MTNTSCQGVSAPGYDPAPQPRRTQDPDDGVDVTLIRWMLSMSPEQRLEVLQNAVDSLEELRDAAKLA
ncbi:hypothetical protein JXA88_06645 [Candidatus Fermentibacteria bacterium]|nr:hypothetical protein [Candidatus Fermentibacteria bacterium]